MCRAVVLIDLDGMGGGQGTPPARRGRSSLLLTVRKLLSQAMDFRFCLVAVYLRNSLPFGLQNSGHLIALLSSTTKNFINKIICSVVCVFMIFARASIYSDSCKPLWQYMARSTKFMGCFSSVELQSNIFLNQSC